MNTVITPLKDEKFNKIAKKIASKKFMLEHTDNPQTRKFYKEDLYKLLDQILKRYSEIIKENKEGLG